MKAPEQESRLSRWSRRKQQTVEETQEEDLVLEVEPQDQGINELEVALSEDQQQSEAQEPVLSDADMEPVETLTENSDFSKFMSPGVSDELRNLALRKMFQAPSFNIRDGLDEYDEDYTSFEKLGDIVTADMRHQMEMMEMEARRKLEAEEKEVAAAEEGVPDKQDLDSDVAQTPSMETEDESSEGADVEPVMDDLAEDEFALENNEIPDRSAEKTQQANE
jgi:hypothetical protein